jgi:hypothetical protein
MPQRRKPHRGTRNVGHRRGSSRIRRRHTTACMWTALVIVSMIATVTIHAQPSFASLYENFMGDGRSNSNINSRSRSGEKGGLARCLKCSNSKSCEWGDCLIPIPSVAVYSERLWEGLVVFAVTFEVLVRGFTLGFGIRMLKYLFFENENTTETTRADVVKSFRRKALLSALAGLSLAAFLHGSSLFVPAEVREEWFAYQHHDHGHGRVGGKAASTTLPLALYEYIERNMVERFRDDKGNLESCPSKCTGELCTQALCHVLIDWTAYFLGRVGTGMAYLATTLEVLLRGFSLGFGARMLKFLFAPDEHGGNRTRNSKSKSNSSSYSNESSDPSSREREHHQQGDDKAATEEIGALLIDSFQHRALVSAISGISVAAVVHGSSLFVPTEMRDRWFGY